MRYKIVKFITSKKDNSVLEIQEEDIIPINLDNVLEVRDCGKFGCKGIWLSTCDGYTYHIVKNNDAQLVSIKVRK